MGKNCKEILAYTGDVMDDRASDQVRDMFFQHLDQCPTCKSKYEISLHIRQLLRDDTVVLGDDFTQAVMGRLRSVRARQKPERKKWEWKKPVFGVAACLVILAAVSIGFLSIREDPVLNTAGDEKMLSVVQDTEEGIVFTAGQEADTFVYDRFLHVIDPELAASSSYTGAQVLEVMNAKSYAFASESYRYITFAQLHTLDSINGNVSCSYIPGYNTGTIYFYKTSLPQSELEWLLQTDMEKIYTLAGSETSSQALVCVVLTDASER